MRFTRGKSHSHFFECSPLSCNNMAKEFAVNRHCLVDDLDQAGSVAERFAVEEPEPGPYYVIEVWREGSEKRSRFGEGGAL